MARPQKHGLDYFPFDCDFFDDEKIVAINGQFGIKGEIAAVKLLCAIYRNGYFIKWCDAVKIKLLGSLRGISEGLLDDIINGLVRWGFFDSRLFSTSDILTSKAIQLRYFNTAKRRTFQGELPYLLIESPFAENLNKSEKTGFLHTETGVSAYNNHSFCIQKPTKKRKENKKESVKKKTADEPPHTHTDFSSRRVSFWRDVWAAGKDNYPEDTIRAFFGYWSEPTAAETPEERKMRFELQRVWNTASRLAAWQRNERRPSAGTLSITSVQHVTAAQKERETQQQKREAEYAERKAKCVTREQYLEMVRNGEIKSAPTANT